MILQETMSEYTYDQQEPIINNPARTTLRFRKIRF